MDCHISLFKIFSFQYKREGPGNSFRVSDKPISLRAINFVVRVLLLFYGNKFCMSLF